ncbi:AAA family ATPase [Nannocystis bainbridge]|uniref:AAA family ATPase n=1 Tax=Nannocystis bainbridge TaxID=2995303 RepID=A0ABT5DYD8_9BACT|nr:ATP-binding protein [Nannocystis bainbridge]MDC0717768.1 AAA family ATPase [Nannocystis bainbridge]
MSIARLQLKDFTVFKQVSFEFCPGINVLMGENGTGKSHVLKAMYAALRGTEEVAESKNGPLTDETRPEILYFVKLMWVFRPDSLSPRRLLRRGSDKLWEVQLVDARRNKLNMRCEPRGREFASVDSDLQPQRSLFVPPREVLAMYKGFVAAYEGRELDFDETYYDICKALGAAPLRGARAEAIRNLLAPLEKILGGKVLLKGDRFYVQQGDAETEAHLLAEGLRKIAGLAYLVANGSLTRDTALFWDEPEASLNPRLVVQVVEFLRALARAGVQVFLASHDFLLLHRLSQPTEHALDSEVPIRFFSLHRPKPDAPVEVETGATLADIEHNAILDEFARYYDDERAYSWREMTADAPPPPPSRQPGKKVRRAAAKTPARSVTAKVRTRKVPAGRSKKQPSARKKAAKKS